MCTFIFTQTHIHTHIYTYTYTYHAYVYTYLYKCQAVLRHLPQRLDSTTRIFMGPICMRDVYMCKGVGVGVGVYNVKQGSEVG